MMVYGRLSAVELQEDFFQRRLLDFQILDISAAQRAQQRVKIADQLQLDGLGLGADVAHAGDIGDDRRRYRVAEAQRDVTEIGMGEFVNPLHRLKLTAAQNRHTVADRLYFIKDVRRQEDRSA